MENPGETLPAASNKIPNERFKQRIQQLVRKDVFSKKEVDEYIKVSAAYDILNEKIRNQTVY